jgi:hypothetical protein
MILGVFPAVLPFLLTILFGFFPDEIGERPLFLVASGVVACCVWGRREKGEGGGVGGRFDDVLDMNVAVVLNN